MTKPQLNIKEVTAIVNKRYLKMLAPIIQYKLGFQEVYEAEMVDLDASGTKLAFLDTKRVDDKTKKRRGYVKFDSEINNEGEFYREFAKLKKEAFEGLKIQEPSTSNEIDNFRLPDTYLMIIVICGMTFLFSFAYRFGLNPTLTEIRDNIGDELIFRTISYILYSNIIVSFISFLVCYLRGGYSVWCTCKWMTSAFFFGMLSLAVLVPSRRLNMLG